MYNYQTDYLRSKGEGRIKAKRTILVKPGCRQYKNTTQATVTLWDLVKTVMDEAGDNDARLITAIVADLIQSGKVIWGGDYTSNSLHC